MFIENLTGIGSVKRMIASVLKTQLERVLVLDKRGRRIPGWQGGKYDKVKTKILSEAPSEARFFHEGSDGKIDSVPRENW